MYESYRTCDSVLFLIRQSHVYMNQFTRKNEWCFTYRDIWMSRFAHIKVSCHLYKSVTSTYATHMIDQVLGFI